MKKIGILLLTVCLAFVLWAQNTSKTSFDAIEKSIKSGNATELSAYFAATIECDLLGEEGIYSKAQATMVIKRFFEKHVPKNFSFKHNSNDKQTVKYAIGTLQTQGGNNLRVTVFVKPDGEALKIQQLRVEKE